MKPSLPLLALALVPLLGARAQDATPFARAVARAEQALEQGDLARARDEIRRAQERDPRSVAAWELRARWAEAAGDRDERVFALHRAHRLTVAQGLKKSERAALIDALAAVDPLAREVLTLSDRYVARLEPVAEAYEGDGRPHAAIRVHKEILALDPERAASRAAIERIASAPDPSLAGDAKPKDLLAGVDEAWIAQHDAEHAEWRARATLERENYVTHTDAGYEVLVRCAEAMEQMNAFYRRFFRYGTEEDGRNVSRIDLMIFQSRDEYLKLGSSPVDWSRGQFTGGSVETYVDENGFEDMVGVLFHEAAHQFVSLATNAAGWLNEGLASFFEGCRILANGTVQMNLPATHRLFPLVERMEQGWMTSAADGIDPDDPSVEPTKAPTFRIVLENQYAWGPAWYAPTWGVVYFLYNFQDPADGRFVYRAAFQDFIDASGGRVGSGAVANFEEVVLARPAPPTPGVASSLGALPATVDALDAVWKDWLTRLADEVSGKVEVRRPYREWARHALARGDLQDALEHFEKGLVETPDDDVLLEEMAHLLAEKLDEEDRAAKLVREAIRAVEAREPVDDARVDALEKKLARYDPSERTLGRVRADLARDAEGLVQHYLADELHLVAMDLAWRLGGELGLPSLFPYYEEAARRSGKTLQEWRLAYNEQDLEGWAAAGNTVFEPQGEILGARFQGEGAFDFRFLVLDAVTSGDFSMEAQIQAERDDVAFVGLVFGKKSASAFHAAILYPPGFDEEGEPRSGFVDLASFHGGDAHETWRHAPVPETREKGASSAGVWRTLRVDVTGAAVDVWLDGAYVATQEFASLAVLRGGFGLILGPGEARFRDVRYLARDARDPAAAIERAIALEGVVGAGGSRGTSWLGVEPPFPKVTRWIGERRTAWRERAGRPQVLALFSVGQNRQIPIDAWLGDLARRYASVELAVVAVCQAWDDAELDAYLAEHPFPGPVGVDAVDPETHLGLTWEDYFVRQVQLPRILLLDVDGKVVWEGDPGFKVGAAWAPGAASYLDAPLADLVARRRLEELAAWRADWRAKGLPALERGDVDGAAPALRASEGFDWRLDPDLLEANGRLNALRAACSDPVAAALALAEERRPALDALDAWAALLGVDARSDAKARKEVERSAAVRDWRKALAALQPQLKKIEEKKELGKMEPLYEKLAALSGPFPAELARDLRAAEAEGEAALRTALLEAAGRPGRWYLRDVLGW